jgi:hypothetical protein
VRPGRETSMHYFSCSGGPGAFSIKNNARTHYAKLVFLYLVRSAGHLEHSGVFRARIVDALFFMPGWDRYRFDKQCAGTQYAELVFLHPVDLRLT